MPEISAPVADQPKSKQVDIELDRTIGISPQFSVHAIDERQLLLLSEERSFRLNGRLYVALVPHLDGKRTGRDVVKAFEARVPADRMKSVLQDMLGKNYVRYLDAAAPMARQAMWVELGLAPADAERRLAACTVAVVPASRDAAVMQATNALRRALAHNGLTLVPRKDANLLIVAVEDYLRRDLAAMNRRMRKTGRPWLLFKAGGSTPLFGPLFRPAGALCWACLRLQILENRPGDTVVDPNAANIRPARGYTAASLDVAAGVAALELVRALAQESPAMLEHHVVSFDLAQRAFAQHLIRLMPHCAVCGTRARPKDILERGRKPVVLHAHPVLPNSDGGWRTLTADQVVERLGRYVSPITGIISGIEDHSPAKGLPVFTARQTNPLEVGPRQNRLIGRPSGAAGKGMSEVQAKASCLGEAMERYLCGYTGHEPRMRAPWKAVKDAAPHPYTYLNYSERQYDTRVEWNAKNDGFNWVGERFDESRSIEWTPAWSLTRDALRWLPTRACYFGYADATAEKEEDENRFCRGDSNGCASGSTLEEAIVQGFFELIERDACGLWWYNRVRRPAFDIAALDDPFVRRTRAYCRERNLELSVLDITNDLGLPAAVAIAHNKSDGKSILFGLGAHFDAEIAVSRALAELNQLITLEGTDLTAAGETQAAGKETSAMLDWIQNHSLETDPYCAPEGTISLGKYERPKISDLKQAVDHCIRAVSDRGYEMIVLDLSRPEIEFATARVVVPGLRHFWARLREGRLYQAPVDLGWLPRPREEAELNPVPFFL
jgi:ribosomal protein S12 methylthiotransferase accessory factor